METAAATMLEAGVGRFRGPNMAEMLAEMWAPLAVALAALATLPSLFRRLQVLILRLRSRGKEVISSHIAPYYSSSDDYDESDGSDKEGEGEDEDEDEESSSGEEDGCSRWRIGYYEGADDDGYDGCFPWGGAVVRTWQDLPRRLSAGGAMLVPGSPSPSTYDADRLWGALTAHADATHGEAWWDADEVAPSAEAPSPTPTPLVVRWPRDHAHVHGVRRRRRLGLIK
ncbi:hypothetical protein GUJ93_ZPchr0009g2092 [Zizania palustris]|uniref:Uncharacterized protein n=1 Tax=Zizania palustris TaxID=103762 RepID=A0A8J5VLX4_ZIZPA|nr:hypothetical protein GUJ93_ZPchr0009g2092 [Zizania palustris]